MQKKTRGVRHPVTRVVPMLLCAAMLTGCAALDSRAASEPKPRVEITPAEVEVAEQDGSTTEAVEGECSTTPRVEVHREAVEGYTVNDEFLNDEAYGEPAKGAPEVEFERDETFLYEEGDLEGKINVSVLLFGLPVDKGERQFATGTVENNAEGTPATYVLATDDAFEAIATRFCLPRTYLTILNWDRPIFSPGDEVLLLPEA